GEGAGGGCGIDRDRHGAAVLAGALHDRDLLAEVRDLGREDEFSLRDLVRGAARLHPGLGDERVEIRDRPRRKGGTRPGQDLEHLRLDRLAEGNVPPGDDDGDERGGGVGGGHGAALVEILAGTVGRASGDGDAEHGDENGTYAHGLFLRLRRPPTGG